MAQLSQVVTQSIAQPLVSSVPQPLYLGGTAGDGTDAPISVNTSKLVTFASGSTFNGTTTLANVTVTGTVVLPSTTSIGTVSSTELGYVDGVTSAIQTQLDSKMVKVSSTDNAIVRFDGTSGAVQNSGITIDDLGNLTVPSNIFVEGSIFSNTSNTGGVYGLIYNKTDDTYLRYGTGTKEDNYWISTTGPRLNDNSNLDPVTVFFNGSNTVQGQMKRVVTDNSGNYVKDYNANVYSHTDQSGLTASQSVMVQIPKFYFIAIEFVYSGKTLNLFLQSLNSFSVDLSDMGFVGATNIVGMTTTGYSSYSGLSGTKVSSMIHPAFNHNDGTTRSTLYMGAFNSYNYTGTSYKSTCTTTGTSTPVKATCNQVISTYRTGHTTFGSTYNTQNLMQREALALTVLIERGTFMTETNGLSNMTKWEGYSWNTSASSDDQFMGQTLPLLNTTGVIRDSSNRTIMNSYRGIEDYHSHLWQFVDGVNIINGVVYLAKHGATYLSDTTASPYFNSGVTTLTSGGGVYISDITAGSFIPKSVSGSSTTKMTDAGWFASGNRVLFVGGGLFNPSSSGVFAWASISVSSEYYWTVGSRLSLLSAS